MFPPLVTRDLEMNGPNQNWKNGDGRMSKQRAAYCCPRSSPCSPLRADRRGRGERTREVQRPRPRAADPSSAPPSALCPHGASGSSLWDKSRRGEIPSAWAAREEEKATSVGRGNLPTKALRVMAKPERGSTGGLRAALAALLSLLSDPKLLRPYASTPQKARPAHGRGTRTGHGPLCPLCDPLLSRLRLLGFPLVVFFYVFFFFPFPSSIGKSARLGLAAHKVYSPSLQHTLRGCPSPLQVSGSRAAGPSRRPLQFHPGTAAQPRSARTGCGDAALPSRSSAIGRREQQPGANLRAGSSTPSSPSFAALPPAEHPYLSTVPFPQTRLPIDETGPGVRALDLSP